MGWKKGAEPGSEMRSIEIASGKVIGSSRGKRDSMPNEEGKNIASVNRARAGG